MRRLPVAILIVAVAFAAHVAAPAFGAPPHNDSFPVAPPPLDGSMITEGTNIEATAQLGEPAHTPNSSPTESVWYAITPATSGPVTVDTCAFADFDTTITVYTGETLDTLAPVGSSEGSLECLLGGSRVQFTASGGTTYRIAVDGVADQEGNFRLWLRTGRPANDDLAAAVSTGGLTSGTFSFDTLNATEEPGEPDHGGDGAAGRSIWFRQTPTSDTLVSLDTCDADFDTVLATYTGTATDSLQLQASSDDSPDCPNGTGSKLTGILKAGQTYVTALDGFAGATGRARLRFTATSVPASDGPTPTVEPPSPQPQVQPSSSPPTSASSTRVTPDTLAPTARLSIRPQRIPAAIKRGVQARIALSEPGRACLALAVTAATARRLGMRPARAQRRQVVFGSTCVAFDAPATRSVRVKLNSRARRALTRLARSRRSAAITARVTTTDTAGNTSSVSRRLVLGR